MSIRSIFHHLLRGVIIMSLVNCAPLPSPRPTAQPISDSPYERKLEATVANQLTIIDDFDFNGTDVSKIGLVDAVELALDVHRWELASYNGHPNKRTAAALNIEETAARRLQINMDQKLLESMKDETTIESMTETASKVKDYFYNVLRANGKVPEADVFFLTVTRLSLTLDFDELLTAVSNKDSQSKEEAKSLLLTGIDDTQQWGQVLPKELPAELQKIYSDLENESPNNIEQVEELQSKVEAWFDDAIKSYLSVKGGTYTK